MAQNDKLHQLILSMSKSEKRYSKLQAGLHGGDKNYIRLFEAILAEPAMNDDEIKNQFEGERFVTHFAVAKADLYRQALKSDVLLREWCYQYVYYVLYWFLFKC